MNKKREGKDKIIEDLKKELEKIKIRLNKIESKNKKETAKNIKKINDAKKDDTKIIKIKGLFTKEPNEEKPILYGNGRVERNLFLDERDQVGNDNEKVIEKIINMVDNEKKNLDEKHIDNRKDSKINISGNKDFESGSLFGPKEENIKEIIKLIFIRQDVYQNVNMEYYNKSKEGEIREYIIKFMNFIHELGICFPNENEIIAKLYNLKIVNEVNAYATNKIFIKIIVEIIKEIREKSKELKRQKNKLVYDELLRKSSAVWNGIIPEIRRNILKYSRIKLTNIMSLSYLDDKININFVGDNLGELKKKESLKIISNFIQEVYENNGFEIFNAKKIDKNYELGINKIFDEKVKNKVNHFPISNEIFDNELKITSVDGRIKLIYGVKITDFVLKNYIFSIEQKIIKYFQKKIFMIKKRIKKINENKKFKNKNLQIKESFIYYNVEIPKFFYERKELLKECTSNLRIVLRELLMPDTLKNKLITKTLFNEFFKKYNYEKPVGDDFKIEYYYKTRIIYLALK